MQRKRRREKENLKEKDNSAVCEERDVKSNEGTEQKKCPASTFTTTPY
jgi:hypothetical protein